MRRVKNACNDNPTTQALLVSLGANAALEERCRNDAANKKPGEAGSGTTFCR